MLNACISPARVKLEPEGPLKAVCKIRQSDPLFYSIPQEQKRSFKQSEEHKQNTDSYLKVYLLFSYLCCFQHFIFS